MSREMSAPEIVVHQSYRKLLKMLPLAFVMFAGAGLIVAIGVLALSPAALLAGAIAVAFFGPAFLILVQALFQPSYLRIDDHGVTCRFYSAELRVTWDNVRDVSGGVGWPSLTFYDCEAVARAARFRGFAPLGCSS